MPGTTSRFCRSTARKACCRAEPRRRVLSLLLLCFFAGLLVQSCGLKSNPRFQPGNDETIRQRTGTSTPDYVTQGDLVSAAERYLGVPYRYGGEDRNGMDCSGLVWRAYMDVSSSELPRTSRQLYRSGSQVAPGDEARGDLVFFATSGRGVNHVGITDGRGRFIHASSSRGVVWDKLSDNYWITRYRGARRLRR